MTLWKLENGKTVQTPVETTVFDLACDVLVVGAGGAGVYVADSASKEGASVVLCEWSENIGGMHVCGNVTGYYYGARGGSYQADDEKNAEDTVFVTSGGQWEQRQIRLTERLQKSDVKLLCKTSAIGLYADENRVVGVLAFDGERTVNIGAKITVDATSDGHLVRMTDVKKRYGRPSDGAFVPFGIFSKYTKDGTVYALNNDCGVMNQYDAEDFSKKTILARASVGRLLKDKEVVNLAFHTGVREGLTFEGEEGLDYQKLLTENKPEKVLFWAYSDLDRHGNEFATEEEAFQNWWVVANLSTVAVNIPVPMGSIMPKGIKGLVTAGRCMDADTYTQSAVRMNRDMFRMGECVGVATAMATLNGVDFMEIDYAEYERRVKVRGCFDKYAEADFNFDNSYGNYLNKMRSLGRTPDKKYEGLQPYEMIREPLEFDFDTTSHLLKTDAPGVAIWSAYRSKDKKKVADTLFAETSRAKDELYRYNCALALGILEDKRALPILREIVSERDCFFFTDNRRSNQFRSAVAVCLLGRLGDEKDLPVLFEILSDNETEREMYRTLEANYLYHTRADRNFVYFAMVTHACMSICKIYRREGLPLRELHQRFRELFEGDKLLSRITHEKEGERAYEETKDFFNYVLKLTDKQ